LRSKSIFLIGILALLVFTIGAASAETFYLTETSETINGNSVPGIRINVTFNGTHIIVVDESTSVDPDKADIKRIRLYLENSSISSVKDTSTSGSVNVWRSEPDNKQYFAGFGEFFTLCDKPTDNVQSRGPIVIALKPSSPLYNGLTLPQNVDNGNSIVVHLGFGTEVVSVGSSWVTGYIPIPEFSTIALPVAAIMGIMLIMGRRRKE